ncbi:hypothetical protein BKA67DRAFT_287491 [Truncatella angustata]|uniref:Uncharacterized protein n=1 Tax=Truncatella angustata TaxID=152316 RepID=A0A9P8UMI6_9PEZI|nr:uncharacterized protein BKA67DRAFT_287491 [Truncatella angustata]KAH6654697.1 hypothetical protein BKA67DRAFT_287491 [Truncatella angustata]
MACLLLVFQSISSNTTLAPRGFPKVPKSSRMVQTTKSGICTGNPLRHRSNPAAASRSLANTRSQIMGLCFRRITDMITCYWTPHQPTTNDVSLGIRHSYVPPCSIRGYKIRFESFQPHSEPKIWWERL